MTPRLDPEPAEAPPSGRPFALFAILVLAAALRLTGLTWGLRHPVHFDEQVFVENAQRMIDEGDLDHRFYYYPGFFFYLLCPVLRLFGDGSPPGPASYLAARCLVAAFGALNVALLYRLGAEMLGRRAGLLAALLLAVSPVAVETAHTVKPDVVLQTFVLLALLAFRRIGLGARGDFLSGVALGFAGAVKFSAIFLVPAYLVARAMAPGRRVLGVVTAGLVALAVFALASPYALLHARAFTGGVVGQIAFHHAERAIGPVSHAQMAFNFTAVWPKALGWPAACLALLGLVLVRREWRVWMPLVLLAAATIGVMATSQIRFDRHMLPSLAVPILLAVAALEALARGRPRLWAIPAAAAVAWPLMLSLQFVRGVSSPGTRDIALDWLGAHFSSGGRILSTVERFGLDPSKWEILSSDPLRAEQRIQALNVDVVVTTPADDPAAVAGLTLARIASPASRWSGPELRVFDVPAGLRPGYRPVRLRPQDLSASPEPSTASLAADGRTDTFWATDGPQRAGDWLEARWSEPVALGRVELSLGPDPRREGRALRVLASEDGQKWDEVPAWPGRPHVEHQIPSAEGFSQVLLLTGTRARGLRLELIRDGARRWAVGELHVFAVSTDHSWGPTDLPHE